MQAEVFFPKNNSNFFMLFIWEVFIDHHARATSSMLCIALFLKFNIINLSELIFLLWLYLPRETVYIYFLNFS